MFQFSRKCYFSFANKLLKYNKSGLPGFCTINIQKSLGLGTESGNILFCRNYQSMLSIKWSYKYEDNINYLNIATVKSTTVITKRHKTRKTLKKQPKEDDSDESDSSDNDENDDEGDFSDDDDDSDDDDGDSGDDGADGAPDTYKDVEIVMTKPRADRIISKALRLTTSEFEKYLYHSKVFLNHKVLLKKAKKIKVGDVLDLQDTGDKVKRVKILRLSLTKGGKERIHVRCWRAPFLLKKKKS